MDQSKFSEAVKRTRREFLATSASGLGLLAFASLLQQDGLLAAESGAPADPLAPRPPHFAPKAKHAIFIYMEGAPSQIELFDPKPKLAELNGQPLPPSLTESVRFAFIQKDSARLLGSNAEFKKYGECGMELSTLLPNIGACADDICLIRSMHTDSFNHHPGQLAMNTGVPTFGRPTIGAWLTYGLGSNSRDLPGYVVLTAGRGTSGGASNWHSGFLPTVYQGTLLRNQGDPVLHLSNPAGFTDEMQRLGLDTLGELNRERAQYTNDPEIASRIAAYELAYRMQSAAPELIDLSDEPQHILDLYGVERTEGDMKNAEGGGRGEFATFARNCLLARRLVERGVRYVNLYHATWDHHQNIDAGLKFNCQMADQPIGALLRDLKQRGLLDETLVIWGSEFGRTPLGENRVGFADVSGRDHHPVAYSIWMAGGGIKGGTVIGETDEIGWNIVRDPVDINDFHATLLHCFGLNHEQLTYRFQGRDFRLTDVAGRVIPQMLA